MPGISCSRRLLQSGKASYGPPSRVAGQHEHRANARPMYSLTQHQVVAQGQMSNKLLDSFLIRPGLGKGPHVHQVGARKTLHVRKGRAQIVRRLLDHLGTPALARLRLQDFAADLPRQDATIRQAIAGDVLSGGAAVDARPPLRREHERNLIDGGGPVGFHQPVGADAGDGAESLGEAFVVKPGDRLAIDVTAVTTTCRVGGTWRPMLRQPSSPRLAVPSSLVQASCLQ